MGSSDKLTGNIVMSVCLSEASLRNNLLTGNFKLIVFLDEAVLLTYGYYINLKKRIEA